jgi:Arc/MetJ family transcription regulator
MNNIELDERLVKKAMTMSGKKTQRETVNAALRSFIKACSRQKLLLHQGTGIWEGDLDEMRAAR